MGMKCGSKRLKVIALGVSLGIVFGLCKMLMAWASMKYGFGTAFVQQMSSMYPGYEATLKGGFMGLAWGFLDGFVMGVLIAFFYNLCSCCSRCCCCSKSCDSTNSMNSKC